MRRRSPASELSGLERAGNAVRAYGTGADDPARARSPLVRGSRSHFPITMVVREKKTRSLRLCCLSGFPDAGAPTTKRRLQDNVHLGDRGAGGSSVGVAAPLYARRPSRANIRNRACAQYVHSDRTVRDPTCTVRFPFGCPCSSRRGRTGTRRVESEAPPR